jgi:hypothetical protein
VRRRRRRIIARTTAPPQCCAGQRVQRGGDDGELRLPCRRCALPPGFAEVQAQQRPGDQRQYDQYKCVAEQRARWPVLMRPARRAGAGRRC